MNGGRTMTKKSIIKTISAFVFFVISILCLADRIVLANGNKSIFNLKPTPTSDIFKQGNEIHVVVYTQHYYKEIVMMFEFYHLNGRSASQEIEIIYNCEADEYTLVNHVMTDYEILLYDENINYNYEIISWK